MPVEQLKRVEAELRDLIQRAIDAGYDLFLSGFAVGADRLFARLVLEVQDENPVRLEAAIPYAGQLNSTDKEFQFLLTRCSAVTVVCEQYTPDCFFIRNRYLVDHSDAVIAVYDGRQRGGSFYTIKYAKSVGKKIAFVRITP